VRIGLGGAQSVLGVTPDITCMGKAVSGGVPASVIGGRRELMELIADRRVFQSGTYNTNPLCLAAIPVVLDRLAEPGTHAEMERLSRRLRGGIAGLIGPLGGYVQGTSTMFGIGFGPGPLRTMRDGWRNSTEKIMELKRALWSTGVYTKPTPRDIWYVSTEHTEADIDQTLERAAEAVRLARF
jgi:glutamate-1-semialdehyde 2,1-aminomutase